MDHQLTAIRRREEWKADSQEGRRGQRLRLACEVTRNKQDLRVIPPDNHDFFAVNHCYKGKQTWLFPVLYQVHRQRGWKPGVVIYTYIYNYIYIFFSIRRHTGGEYVDADVYG